MAISFTNHEIKLTLKHKTRLKNWISEVIKQHKKQNAGLNFIFTGDEQLLIINRQYLSHNTYTDIITFDYSEDKKISGDIFISTERVYENSKKFKTDFETELHRVMIHGVLHLLGYKDKKQSDKSRMRKQEDRALKKLQRG